MALYTRDEALEQLGDIPNTKLRYSIHKLLTDYKAMELALDEKYQERKRKHQAAQLAAAAARSDERTRMRKGRYGGYIQD